MNRIEKMTFINLDNIQKGRNAFMGLAILWVILFHYSEKLSNTLISPVIEKGFLGVDIFLLLSSFGLCFSLKRDNNYVNFIKRRVKRIIPTWWIVYTFILVLNIVLQKDHPNDIFQIICYYSGAGWWLFNNPDLLGVYYWEWYIPTLLYFYLFAPFLFKLNTKKLSIIFIASIIISIVLSYFHIAQTLFISYSRIPVFIYGFLIYRMYSGEIDAKISRTYLCVSSIAGLILFVFAMSFKFKYGLNLYCFMFALPLLLNVCYILLRGLPVRVLSFIGTLTLQLYLIHNIYGHPLGFIRRLIPNRIVAVCVTLILLIVVSYVFSIVVSYMIKKLESIATVKTGDEH